jgi:hypothetical protein
MSIYYRWGNYLRSFGGDTSWAEQQKVVVPSEDGTEVYEFTPEGRHEKTRDALTGALLHEFGYVDDRLVSVTDGSGNVTESRSTKTLPEQRSETAAGKLAMAGAPCALERGSAHAEPCLRLHGRMCSGCWISGQPSQRLSAGSGKAGNSRRLYAAVESAGG